MAIPLNVISGFLGSGKTTLLNRLLTDPALGNALVLINEFGEVGLDHLLVGRLDETTVLLQSGCVCCTVRDDLLSSLESIIEKQESGALGRIDRVVLETTGLVDPAPIAATLGHHSPLRGKFEYDGMLVTVDAMNWEASLSEHAEARSQIALADKLYITKLDLCPEERERIVAKLQELNPRAAVYTPQTEVDPREMLSSSMVRPKTGKLNLSYWIAPGSESKGRSVLVPHSHEHSHVRSFVVEVDDALNLSKFAAWTSLFAMLNGERLLRLKALVCVDEEPGYLAFDAIRSYVHPPTEIPAAPGTPRRSTVVFILKEFTRREEELARQAIEGCAVGNNSPREETAP